MKILMFVLPLIAHLLNAGSLSLLRRETMEIPVARYRTVRFVLPEHLSDDASLFGNLCITPDTASVELILLHIDDYLRWKDNAGTVDTLEYRSVLTGQFEMGIPGLGSYALVISNRGNFRPVSLILDLEVLFAGSGETGDPLPAALRLALLLMMAGTVAVAVGSVLTKRGHRRKHIT